MSCNAVPIFGLVFLDWRAVNLIVLYFIGFMADVGLVFVLFMLLEPELRKVMEIPPGAVGTVKMAFALVLALAIFMALFAFVLGMPVFWMLGMDSDASLARLFAN